MSAVQRSDFEQFMVPNYAPAPMLPVRGMGARLWDQEGRDYIDFGAGVAVNSLGHAHPVMIKALTEQAERLWHVSNYYATEPELRLARRLVEATFAERVFFCNSGAEANEAALKLARRAAIERHGEHKVEILAFNGSFHGRTFFTVSVGGQAKYSAGFGPRPGAICHVEYNDIGAALAAIGTQTCAVIVEPVVGESGVVPANPGFLQALRAATRAHDAFLIFDEVQSGNGRTGHLFAYEKYDVVPDILTTAKGLGGGFPIGAMLTTAAIAAHLSPGTHGSTYGGNPLACAVADAVLEFINRPQLLASVRDKADRMAERLAEMGQRLGCFAEVRHSGLWFGCQLAPAYAGSAKKLYDLGVEAGVLTLQAGPDVLRIATSLVIEEAEIDAGLARLEQACKRLVAG